MNNIQGDEVETDIMLFLTNIVLSRHISRTELYNALDSEVRFACEPHPLIFELKRILMKKDVFHVWNLETINRLMIRVKNLN